MMTLRIDFIGLVKVEAILQGTEEWMEDVEMDTACVGSLFKKFSCKEEDGDRTIDEGKQRFVCL